MKIFVYIDHFKGEAQATSWEALGLAKSFGATTAIVLVLALMMLRKPRWNMARMMFSLPTTPLFWIFALRRMLLPLRARLFSDSRPDSVPRRLAPASSASAMSAVDLNTNVLTDATAVEVNSIDSVVVTRPIYEAKLFEKVTASAKPQFITLRGRASPKPERVAGKSGTITKVEAKTDALTTVEGYSVADVGVGLNDMSVIVRRTRRIRTIHPCNHRWTRQPATRPKWRSSNSVVSRLLPIQQRRSWRASATVEWQQRLLLLENPVKLVKPVKSSRPICISPAEFPARSNISQASALRRWSSRSTKTPTRRSSRSLVMAWSATCSKSSPR
ncbi:MAG: hypothetical protein U0X87_10465 [Anaerolineales bacterium]